MAVVDVLQYVDGVSVCIAEYMKLLLPLSSLEEGALSLFLLSAPIIYISHSTATVALDSLYTCYSLYAWINKVDHSLVSR